MHQIPNKFPVLALLQVLFITPRAMISQFRARQMSMKELENRISQRGLTQHLDHFDQLLSAGAPEPDAKQKGELDSTSAQLLLAGWGPVTSQFRCCLMFAPQEPEVYRQLVQEIRRKFQTYGEITPPLPHSLA